MEAAIQRLNTQPPTLNEPAMAVYAVDLFRDAPPAPRSSAVVFHVLG